MREEGLQRVYLLTGGNEGDRHTYLREAAGALAGLGRIFAASSLWETAAWGVENQAPFLNQALGLQTALQPEALLRETLAIETRLGRVRQVRYGPRTLDIDLLLWEGVVMHTEALQLPHPGLPARRFALEPLSEIAPHVVHPVLGRTVAELLAACPDPLTVHKIL